MKEIKVTRKNIGQLWKLDQVVGITKVADGGVVVKVSLGYRSYSCVRAGDAILLDDNGNITIKRKEQNE